LSGSVKEVFLVAGDAVDVWVQGITEEDLILLEDVLGLLLGIEIRTLDISVFVEQLLDSLIYILAVARFCLRAAL
jgi:hypothetical protein